jgi:putative Mg2+ transporter-C (MgtC) family protein
MAMLINEIEITARLLAACLFGGAVGWERERTFHPAGLRTHILVCVGSALVMVISMYAFDAFITTNKDPARLAAQVVSGIGFLGAGTILREGVSVKGLTTAASLWVVAGIGLAAGSGFYYAAILTSLLVTLTLRSSSYLEKKAKHKQPKYLKIIIKNGAGLLEKVCVVIERYGILIQDISMHLLEGGGVEQEKKFAVEFSLIVPASADLVRMYEELAALEGVHAVEKAER